MNQLQSQDRLERRRVQNRASVAKYRLKVLSVVAKKGPLRCAYCGCDDAELLEINHRNGGGRKERDVPEAPLSGGKFYTAILRGDRSVDDLELACRVCNARDYLERKFPEIKGSFIVEWFPYRV